MKNKAMAKQVREFLLRYFELENSIQSQVNSLIAVKSIWIGYYKLIMKDGKSTITKK